MLDVVHLNLAVHCSQLSLSPSTHTHAFTTLMAFYMYKTKCRKQRLDVAKLAEYLHAPSTFIRHKYCPMEVVRYEIQIGI